MLRIKFIPFNRKGHKGTKVRLGIKLLFIFVFRSGAEIKAIKMSEEEMNVPEIVTVEEVSGSGESLSSTSSQPSSSSRPSSAASSEVRHYSKPTSDVPTYLFQELTFLNPVSNVWSYNSPNN